MARLRIVRPAPAPDEPPLDVGDTCRLNSGSPLLTVVAASSLRSTLIVADRDGGRYMMARAALRRFRRVV